ncbi:MAG: hypothetical protein JWO73_40 [Candidatus Taylorbacteria bacterium]|nr:hypothetical protein [Candidatus Taylorbacteria bacterium]
MKSKIIAFLLLSLMLAVFAGPAVLLGIPLANAQSAGAEQYPGLVKCDGVVDGAYEYQADPNKPDSTSTIPVFVPAKNSKQKLCNFTALIEEIQFLINWLFKIAVPIAIALFAYAGFLYMTGEPGKIKTAKSMFSTVGVGFGFMLISWFVIYTVLHWLVRPGQGFDALLK